MRAILTLGAIAALALWGLTLTTEADESASLHADSIAYDGTHVDVAFSVANPTPDPVTFDLQVAHYDSSGSLVDVLYETTITVSGESYSSEVTGLTPTSPLDSDWFRMDLIPVTNGVTGDADWICAGGVDDPAGPWA
jgi:hypothetical protein